MLWHKNEESLYKSRHILFFCLKNLLKLVCIWLPYLDLNASLSFYVHVQCKIIYKQMLTLIN